MKFGNPISSVPLINRDVFYWPCISGESFPPSFSAGSGYGTFIDSPTAFVNIGGPTTSNNALWPVLPRVGTQNQQKFVVSGRILFSWTAPGAGNHITESFFLNNAGGSTAPSVEITWRTDQPGVVITIKSDVYGNKSVTLAPPVLEKFYDFLIAIEPNGLVEVYWNDTLAVSGQTEWVKGATTPGGSTAPQMVLDISGNVAGLIGEVDVTQLEAKWLT